MVLTTGINVKAQYNLTLAGHLSYAPDQLSSIWGYTDDTGREYALVGATQGTSIVDISAPTSPEEIFFIPGAESAWREIKTWDHYAYVTNETGGGVLIIDLTNLPDAIDTISYKGDATHDLQRAHTLFIDENGIAYFFGFNVLFGDSEGAFMADLQADPMHPQFVGTYGDVYIHDGFVRGDTLYAAEIYEAKFEIIDATDKTDLTPIGTQNTTGNATHNCWPSDDGKYLFTTDESLSGYISSFDISDVTDIQLLDQIKHGDPDSTIAHNTHYLNGFLINAHYTEGVTLVDAHRPYNLVETGFYDTSVLPAGIPFGGVWGVYPYFNSGLIVASDIEEGLFILQPEYIRACYLEGTVKNEATGMGIFDAKIKIMGTDVTDSTSITGIFKTGYHQNGNYSVEVSADGCATKIYPDIVLENSVVTNLDATLDCTLAVSDMTPTDFLFDAQYDAAVHSIACNWQFPAGENGIVRLSNLQGAALQTLLVNNSGNTQINIAALPKGIYLITALAGNKKVTRTIAVD